MDRSRDRRYDDRDFHRGGESYRPSDRGGRSPPRGDSYRGGNRSPPRRQRSPYDNNYSRGGRGDDRRRSRSRSPIRRSPSPSRRNRGDDYNYRGRDRTPPRFTDRRRSPLRRRPSPSPPRHSNRDNSPPRRRARDPTPPSSYRQRSPPPRHGRYSDSERDGYNRGYQGQRDEPRRFPKENNYRPRERSRTPPRHSAHNSRGETPLSSRRSSPRPHPDRARVVDRASPGYNSHRQDHPSDRRSPAYRSREHSPPPRRAQSPPPPRSPVHEALPRRERERERERTPPPRERAPASNGVAPSVRSNPPPSSSNFERAPPSGPSSSRYENFHRDPAPATSGQSPSSASPGPSSHARPPLGPSGSTPISAPTRPRGGPYPPREPSYGEGRGRHFNGPPPRQQSHDGSPIIPTGPRGGPGGFNSNTSHFAGSRGPPAFRSNNSTSTTYPRTQRFNNHLAGGPTIIEGGKKLPSVLDPEKEKKLLQLEDDKKKLMAQIEEKQRTKRHGLREWEKAERESARETLRAELAEGHLERLSGEVGAGGY